MRTANGTAEANRRYCLKDDPDGEEWGIPTKSKKGQGRRTDWEEVHRLAQERASVQQFCSDVPGLAYQHIGKIETWREVWREPVNQDWPRRPIILYGPPGSGKSTWARELSPQAWEKDTREEKGWNGYDGVSDIIINEMDGGWFRYSDLKRLLDYGPFRGTLRYGGFVEVKAKRIIMTTNFHPATWYKDAGDWDEQNALRRRIIDFGELWVFQPPIRYGDPVRVWCKEPRRDFDLLPPPQKVYEHVGEVFDHDRQGFFVQK